MFHFNDQPHMEALDARIAELLDNLNNVSGETEEYTKITDNLSKLIKLKNETLKNESDAAVEFEKIKTQNENVRLEDEKLEHERNVFAHAKETALSWKPSPDAIVGAAASVLGILTIIHHEKIGVITSKALGFVGKSMK